MNLEMINALGSFWQDLKHFGLLWGHLGRILVWFLVDFVAFSFGLGSNWYFLYAFLGILAASGVWFDCIAFCCRFLCQCDVLNVSRFGLQAFGVSYFLWMRFPSACVRACLFLCACVAFSMHLCERGWMCHCFPLWFGPEGRVNSVFLMVAFTMGLDGPFRASSNCWFDNIIIALVLHALIAYQHAGFEVSSWQLAFSLLA